MYSPKALFQKQPVVIAGALRSILYVLILGGVLHISADLLAAIALSAEIVLGLFSFQSSTPTAAPTLERGTEVKVAGSEETSIV